MATGMNVDCRYQSRQEEKYTFLIKNYVQSFEDKEVLAVVQKPPCTIFMVVLRTPSQFRNKWKKILHYIYLLLL